MGLCGSRTAVRRQGLAPGPSASGSSCSTATGEAVTAYPPPQAASTFHAIPDQFETLEQVQEALREAGLEASNLIVAVDFTRSNEYSGKRVFGKHMHALDPTRATLNPYQQVLTIIARTLAAFDEDNYIPALGFGDAGARRREFAPFPFRVDGAPCEGLPQMLQEYERLAASVAMSGPTLLAPVIRAAIAEVRRERGFHILLVVGDGIIEDGVAVCEALRDAAAVPLAVVFVGVGDGPWDAMEAFDDGLRASAAGVALPPVDNFQFVNFHRVMAENPPVPGHPNQPEIAFAIAALTEVPDQFRYFKQQGMLA